MPLSIEEVRTMTVSEKICENCGKTFHKRKNQSYAEFAQRTKYCSVLCRAQGRTGETNDYQAFSIDEHWLPNSFRNAVRKFYGTDHPCMVCGWNETTCDVAHIEPGIHKLNNAAILCPNCHRTYDKGILSKKRVVEALEKHLRKEVLAKSA